MKLGFPQYKNLFSTLKMIKIKKSSQTFSRIFEQFFANTYFLDAVGSWQIILPMPKSERTY